MSTNSKAATAVAALRLLPKNALSRAAGQVAALRLPAPLQSLQIRAFASAFGIDWSEVREPVAAFDSLQAFFVRSLREGVRPIDDAADSIVAPCDGRWGMSGRIESGTLLQVKGRPYRVADLVADATLAERLDGGEYATFYLSPRDYHRFHTPARVRIVEARYVPGELWPVNRIGVEGVDALFAQNERISAVMSVEDATHEGCLCVVAVGATLVGKIRVRFDDLTTNEGGGATRRSYGEPEPFYEKGEEWGNFEFGSTLVLLAAPGVLELDHRPPGTPVRLGSRIGRRLDAVA